MDFVFLHYHFVRIALSFPLLVVIVMVIYQPFVVQNVHPTIALFPLVLSVPSLPFPLVAVVFLFLSFLFLVQPNVQPLLVL